ncbi:hypothetical protein [Synechococcus sp. RS9916]|uniref:hypothetical protein n=1 Tax=Synechococcus sp. RS9916 TaxID=221359 RepID=UPI0000E53FFE|nr:hypothetical protein [Synechococcus sp. RS9916]EAU73726.1 hypothetical protein RS9916_29494 [Synechococcus sp. RS9916]
MEVESASSSLQVEPLKAVHLSWLQATDQTLLLPRLQTLLVRGWLAQAESFIPGLLLNRHPLALVASEDQNLRSLLLSRPHNRQASCWRLELQTLSPPSKHSQGDLNRALFKLALTGGHARSRSWVVRCSASDNVQIGILRELGFQPIRTFRRWRPQPATTTLQPTPWPQGCSWVPINRQSAPLLWALDQASTTSHQRQIVDRHPIDLLDQAGAGSGVLLTSGQLPNDRSSPVAIAGLVRQQRSDDAQVFELLRGPAWDQRLDAGLPALVNQLQERCTQATLVCNSEDSIVAAQINSLGWHSIDDELLLGRSLWRRQAQARRLQATRPLESMLGRLQPQQPPLPTPVLGRR